MCGISGIISLDSSPLSREREGKVVGQMAGMLRHRGPTHTGFYGDDRIHLGNARLSILDRREHSNLPMSDEEGSVVLCYNGEVSNYIELKRKYKLDSKYSFKGSSDSEVLIYLYKELGIEFVNELTGMFSFCLYDKTVGKAWLVRDFFGITPHFYAVCDHKVYFASELKALLEVPGLDLTIDKQSIFDFLTFAYIPGTQTPYRGIVELRNGQMMEIDLRSGRRQLRYYFRPRYDVDYGIDEKEASEKVYDLLLDSVDRNLRSDAPIGTTLSGGVDTSGITCLIRDLGRSKDFHTYSIKMGESSFDESHYQRLVAKECGTQHHEVPVTPEQVIENFYECIAYLDEPNGNGATVPSYILAKEAKKTVDVLLSGEGGDEVFSAYSVYAAWKVAKYYKKLCPKILRKMIYLGVHALPSDYKKLSFDFMAKRFTEGCELHPGLAHIYWRHPFVNAEKESLCSFSDGVVSTDERIVSLFDEYSHTEELNRISMLDMEHFIVDDLLVKNDRMFLAHSVESRFPYLDRLLFDYVSTIPSGLRLKKVSRAQYSKKRLE